MNSYRSQSQLKIGNEEYEIFRLDSLEKQGMEIHHLPYSLRVLLENLLRTENGRSVTADDIHFLANWKPEAVPSREIAFTPARVLMQDFTGVPAIVDLAAMRDAVRQMGGDAGMINPLQPAELVIDHSVQVDEFGTSTAMHANALLEFQRNQERYGFLRWGQSAFHNFLTVPPDMGIVHQVNLEYLARVVFTGNASGKLQAYPDSLIGTDSHTTMVNGLGVLGWGAGGIEAEAAMLGQPVSMLIPQVVGFKLSGRLAEGSTATDLVLTVTEILRNLGVVGKFVEFYGDGLNDLPLADRATIANMAPEYGATCGIFPVDNETLRYLRMTGRPEEKVALVEAYCKEQGLFRTAGAAPAHYSQQLELDLGTVEPSIAGPKRPQDRVRLSDSRISFETALPSLLSPKSALASAPKQEERFIGEGGNQQAMVATEEAPPVAPHMDVSDVLRHGSVVIAAITSCTNTSNPSVMIAAGLLAKKAAERGLFTKPWVKTSLAPGSRVVSEYFERAGLTPFLEQQRFHTVGYGCTTCIGNSGPLPEDVSRAVQEQDLVVVSVLSGNRNFEGRINSEVRANYLMSPPLVVAFALAGRIDIDLMKDPIGRDKDRNPVYLRDIWPTQQEVSETIASAIDSEMFRHNYETVFDGDESWQKLRVPQGDTYAWDEESTYIKRAPYFDDMPANPARVEDINNARVLAKLRNSVTTDHISPAGSIKATSPAGEYLMSHGIAPRDFNSYGSRRGNHEVMVRGTFANVRLRNRLVPQSEGGVTRHLPDGEIMSIFAASEKYRAEGVPLIILAGKEYGSGSSRDWAAKGPMLLGVRAVIAESYERIHRSNLVGMGILPLQFVQEEDADSLGLSGEECYSIAGLEEMISEKFRPGRQAKIRACRDDGSCIEFPTTIRIDTPQELLYYEHGGILQYVLRQLLASGGSRPEVVEGPVAQPV